MPEGFAVVTRLERFEPGGISAAAPSRWSLEMPPLAVFDLFAYVKALLAAETGHFRVIAFVVTSAPFAAGEAGIDTETLARWSGSGTNALPVAVRAWPFGDGHAVTALVYEFTRVRGGRSVKLNLPSETSAQEHLTASHILASLEGG